MSIFSGLFKSRDKPENRTPGSSYAFYLGGSSSGKLVTERSAMQMTAVYACVRILSEAIAGLPLHIFLPPVQAGKVNPLFYHWRRFVILSGKKAKKTSRSTLMALRQIADTL